MINELEQLKIKAFDLWRQISMMQEQHNNIIQRIIQLETIQNTSSNIRTRNINDENPET
jgi:hypothetical protein